MILDDLVDDHRQSGSGPAHLKRTAGKEANDYAPDDAGNEPCDRRGSRRDGDAHTEWQRHQEYNYGGQKIF
jgi:hypothetical protein